MGRRRLLTGADAWRNGFTANAADLIAVMLWAAWDFDTFMRALVLCGRYTRGERTNERTALRVIQQVNDEIEGVEAARARRKEAAARFLEGVRRRHARGKVG
jgi:hypothetical protein